MKHNPSSIVRFKNWYYQQYCIALYGFFISPQKSVIHIGCSSGFFLNTLQPSYGVGIDQDPEAISKAKKRYPHYTFIAAQYEHIILEQQFDYIVLSDSLMKVYDIVNFLKSIQKLCHEHTRIFFHCYAPWWKWILTISTWCGAKPSLTVRHWLTYKDITNFLYLNNFEVVTHKRELLCSYYIPFISYCINNIIAHIPLINHCCLINFVVARPIYKGLPKEHSASIVVACKNEEGTIKQAIERCPLLGTWTELIFVEGGSTDNTAQIIDHYINQPLRTDIIVRHFKQGGVGKADAVRTGFAHAQGDIFLILDADLTVMPEDLCKFFDAITHAKGDFINGSRLMYSMESKAMKFLNFIANYLFGKGFSWLLGQQFNDTLCGTKALRKKDYEIIAAQRSFITHHDPFGDFDLIFGAAKQCLKIIEIPVHYKNRVYGQTQISRFKDGYMLLYMAFTAFKRFKCRKIINRCVE